MRRWIETIAIALLGAVAGAGLVASTSEDLGSLMPLHIGGFWLLPGLIAIGTLMTLSVSDFEQGAIALVIAGFLGAIMYGTALASPGFEVANVRVTLINRGTTQGLAALLLIVLFGMIGMVVAWVVRAYLGRGTF